MSLSENSDLANLLRLRFVVGALGESWGFSWWPTSFLDPSTSRAFLAPVFAKTSHLAAYRGVLEAACRIHDEHLSAGSYHLFRLRQELEQDLHQHMQANKAIADSIPKTRDDGLAALKAMASPLVKRSAGPVLLGGKTDPRSRAFLGSAAALYHAAFLSGDRCFPYFTRSE